MHTGAGFGESEVAAYGAGSSGHLYQIVDIRLGGCLLSLGQVPGVSSRKVPAVLAFLLAV